MTEERSFIVGAPASVIGAEATEVAPKRTPRTSLKAQREEILSTLYIDLRVPRWPNEIWVRYAPLKSAKVDESIKRRAANEFEANEASLLVHADILISACIGIYQTLDGDFTKKYALRLDENGEPEEFPTEQFTRFDKNTAAFIGLNDFQSNTATNIVRALYLTDGDLIDASNVVSNWSSKANERAEEDFTKP